MCVRVCVCVINYNNNSNNNSNYSKNIIDNSNNNSINNRIVVFFQANSLDTFTPPLIIVFMNFHVKLNP